MVTAQRAAGGAQPVHRRRRAGTWPRALHPDRVPRRDAVSEGRRRAGARSLCRARSALLPLTLLVARGGGQRRAAAARRSLASLAAAAGLPDADAAPLGAAGEAILWSRAPAARPARRAGGRRAGRGGRRAAGRLPQPDGGFGPARRRLRRRPRRRARRPPRAGRRGLPRPSRSPRSRAPWRRCSLVYVLAHASRPPLAPRPAADRARRLRAGQRGHVAPARRHRGVPGQDRPLLAGRRPRGPELGRTCGYGAAVHPRRRRPAWSPSRGPLDLLSLGEDEAASLGLPVHAARMAVLALAALVAGAATAVAGSVPFVGLVAPHALRPLVGPLGRHLLPAAFLGGRAPRRPRRPRRAHAAAIASTCRWASLTAFVGAPYFLLALRGERGTMSALPAAAARGAGPRASPAAAPDPARRERCALAAGRGGGARRARTPRASRRSCATLAGLLPAAARRRAPRRHVRSRAWARDALARAVALVTPEEEGPDTLERRGPRGARAAIRTAGRSGR